MMPFCVIPHKASAVSHSTWPLDVIKRNSEKAQGGQKHSTVLASELVSRSAFLVIMMCSAVTIQTTNTVVLVRFFSQLDTSQGCAGRRRRFH